MLQHKKLIEYRVGKKHLYFTKHKVSALMERKLQKDMLSL